MSFGFQHYDGDRFSSWQIMFLVVGLITICMGIVGKVQPKNVHVRTKIADYFTSDHFPARQSYV